MSAGGDAGVQTFRAAYASALTDYLRAPSEESLRIAYELGREAVSRQLGMLELAVTYQESLLAALAEVSGTEETRVITRAAGAFFLESLSSFEMVQRGFREAREEALLERRQTEMSRQLSSFLADASVALEGTDSLDEMLRLVAEQARELVDAKCCVATVAIGGRPRAAEGVSCSEGDRRWTEFVRWLDLFAIYRLIGMRGGSARLSGDELAGSPPFRRPRAEPPLEGWLAASLTSLEGTELGAIQLFDKHHGAFTKKDEAVIVYLAQLASAAVERAQLYKERG
jgi:hypothetical protein